MIGLEFPFPTRRDSRNWYMVFTDAFCGKSSCLSRHLPVWAKRCHVCIRLCAPLEKESQKKFFI